MTSATVRRGKSVDNLSLDEMQSVVETLLKLSCRLLSWLSNLSMYPRTAEMLTALALARLVLLSTAKAMLSKKKVKSQHCCKISLMRLLPMDSLSSLIPSCPRTRLPASLHREDVEERLEEGRLDYEWEVKVN